jgi:hypothetical protein
VLKVSAIARGLLDKLFFIFIVDILLLIFFIISNSFNNVPCLLSFGAEAFVFPFVIQKLKD